MSLATHLLSSYDVSALPDMPKSFWQRAALEFAEDLGYIAGYRAKMRRVQERKRAEAQIRELLMPREVETLRLLAHCLSNKQIAERMGGNAETVRRRLVGVYAKLGVHSRTQAALYAWRAELVTIDEAWATVAAQRKVK